MDSPSLFQGEVKGDITVISFKLGNAGIVASGWGVKRFDKLIGTMVIQSLDLLAEMGMKSALTVGRGAMNPAISCSNPGS